MNDQGRVMAAQEQVSISRRLIPGLLAAILFLLFGGFMIGYFLGVKHTTDEFVTQIRQETLADQLMVSSVTPSVTTTSSEQEPLVTATPIAANIPAISVPSDTQQSAEQPALVAVAEPSTSPVARYSAELIGFGTKTAAEEFMGRVARYDAIPLELKARQSKTPRGRTITWYQIVTGKYEQKQELQKLLNTLIKKEHLHDIKIVAYAPSAKDLA